MAVYLQGKKIHIDLTSAVAVTLSPNRARTLAMKILRETGAIDEGRSVLSGKKPAHPTIAQRIAYALSERMGGRDV